MVLSSLFFKLSALFYLFTSLFTTYSLTYSPAYSLLIPSWPTNPQIFWDFSPPWPFLKVVWGYSIDRVTKRSNQLLKSPFFPWAFRPKSPFPKKIDGKPAFLFL